jgi:hypothetical protein
MLRGLLSLLIALGVLGSPLTRELCLVRCASDSAHDGADHDAHDSSSRADHSCHESDSSGTPLVGAIPHACDHDAPEPFSTPVVAADDLRCASAHVWVAPPLPHLPDAGAVSSIVRMNGSRAGRPHDSRSGIPLPLRI